MKQRNREYLAPWRQERISQEFLSALAKEVDAQLSDAVGGLAGISFGEKHGQNVVVSNSVQLPRKADRTMERTQPSGSRGGNQASQVLFELRARLVARFGTLRNSFQVMDINKDGSLTYGELTSSLAKHGLTGQEAIWERDLRAAFGMLDIHEVGHLSLGEWLRGSGEHEDEVATAAAAQAPEEARSPRRALPLGERPGWSQRKVATSAQGHKTLDVQREEDPLPPRPQTPQPSGRQCRKEAHQGVVRRTEEMLQRRQRTVQDHEQKNEQQHAKDNTLKPKLSSKSKHIMKGRHVKPWEGRQWEDERILDRRMKQHQAAVDTKDAHHHTFHPQLHPRSLEMFSQLADDGEAWHDRLHSQSKGLKTDRMNLSFKKLTPEFEETWLRERVPTISSHAKLRARSADEGRDVHKRLFENLGRTGRSKSKNTDDGVGRYTRSTSFLLRPSSARESNVGLLQHMAGRPMHGGVESSEDSSPVRTVRSASPSRSPAKGGAPSPQSTVASAMDISSPTKHRVFATADVVDVLAACGPHARQLDMDVADLQMISTGQRSRQ